MTATLSARLRDGTGADRELDADIERHFLGAVSTNHTCQGGEVYEVETPAALTSDLTDTISLARYLFPEAPDDCRALLLALLASTQKE